MAKTIVYNGPTGVAVLLRCSDHFIAMFESEAEGLDAIIAKDVPEGVAYKIIDDDHGLPSSLDFRNAWVLAAGNVEVDMPRARVIHMERIKVARTKALDDLDIPFMRALEAGDVALQTSIASAKQALRDLPQTINLDQFETPEALAAFWPEELNDA